ncbi:hypothetical protein CSUI_000265 [Cystoisospora suis]|uniref:Uncharacterized protein n=1 Tax=Cystoisospora suis TaxID=483139 RepID=A0A2C6LG81_9APIC|nr:hypothetical protein CSUI_000265 [Cystoisospora suis]
MYPSQGSHPQQVRSQHLPPPQNAQKETSAQSTAPGAYAAESSSRYGYNPYTGAHHGSPPLQHNPVIPSSAAFPSASAVSAQPPSSSPSPCHPFQNYPPPASMPYAPVTSTAPPSQAAAFHHQQPGHERQHSASQSHIQEVRHAAGTTPAPLLIDAGCPPGVPLGSIPAFSTDHPNHSFVQRMPSPYQQVNSLVTVKPETTSQIRGGDGVGQGQPGAVSPLHPGHSGGGGMYDKKPQAATAHLQAAPRSPPADAGSHQPSPHQNSGTAGGDGATPLSEGRCSSFVSPRQSPSPASPSWTSPVVAGSPQCAYASSLPSSPVPGQGSPRFSHYNAHQPPHSTETPRPAGETARPNSAPVPASVPTTQPRGSRAGDESSAASLPSPSFPSAPPSWASGSPGPVTFSNTVPQTLPIGHGRPEQPGFSSGGAGGGTGNSPGSTPTSRASNESSDASSGSSSANAGGVAAAPAASASHSPKPPIVSTSARDTSPAPSPFKSGGDGVAPPHSPIDSKAVSPAVSPSHPSHAVPVGPPLSPDTLRRLLNARRGHIRKNPLLRYLEGTAYISSNRKRERSPGDEKELTCDKDTAVGGSKLALRGCRTPINTDLYYGYSPSHTSSSSGFASNISGNVFSSTPYGLGGGGGVPSGSSGAGAGNNRHQVLSSKCGNPKNASGSGGSHVGPLGPKEATGPPGHTSSSSSSRVGAPSGGRDFDSSSASQTGHPDRKGQNPSSSSSSSSSSIIGNTAALSASTSAATAKDDSLQWCHLQIQQVLSQNGEIARAAGKARGCRPLLHQSVLADATLTAAGASASTAAGGFGGPPHSQLHSSSSETAAGWRRWRDVDVVPPPPQLEELLLVLAAAVKVHIAELMALACACEASEAEAGAVPDDGHSDNDNFFSENRPRRVLLARHVQAAAARMPPLL